MKSCMLLHQLLCEELEIPYPEPVRVPFEKRLVFPCCAAGFLEDSPACFALESGIRTLLEDAVGVGRVLCINVRDQYLFRLSQCRPLRTHSRRLGGIV